MRYVIIAGLLLMTACTALNSQPRQARSWTNDEVVCRREVPTGSRVGVRVCRSRAEMEQRRTADRDLLREVRGQVDRMNVE
jgi:hypothetical protein